MKGFPNNDVMDNMTISLTAGGCRKSLFFSSEGVGSPSKFDIVIPKTSVYRVIGG